MEYPLVDISEAGNTRDRILLTAAKMFAERGFAAVSVREIANGVNIKPASIYNHFESKEALFETIIETITTVYLDYYARTNEKIKKAASFKQVLECLFEELIEVYHMFIYYGVSLIASEQFRDEKARYVFNETYIKKGIYYSKNAFDECVKKGWVKPFDTEALATVYMNTVFVGSLMRAHEDMGHATAYDAKSMFLSAQAYMLGSVEIIE